jgi:hypothetical protein
MAPQDLLPRQFVNDNNNVYAIRWLRASVTSWLTVVYSCVDQFGNEYYCRSGWYGWGRWVLFGVIIAAAILFFFLFR